MTLLHVVVTSGYFLMWMKKCTESIFFRIFGFLEKLNEQRENPTLFRHPPRLQRTRQNTHKSYEYPRAGFLRFVYLCY